MTKVGHLWICTILGAVLIHPVLLRADSAQDAFANGKAWLAKADFQRALAAFAEAARANRSEAKYLQHYATVRQVIALRARLETEKDPSRWEYIARGLHAFYTSQGILTEALSLDQKMHAKLNTATSALMLAETQMALKMNAEAAGVLGALDPAKQTTATRALRGLALARQGKAEQARKLVGGLEVPENADPGTTYSAARFHAAMGNDKQALGLLTRCFESVAPSQLDGLKNHAQQSPDFATLVSTAGFAEVLKTKSKVPESECSGGSGCAGCPMRAKCNQSAGH